jgi:hypothetical protein
VNPNIRSLIDATPKGEGGKWISIHQAEALVAQTVREAASIARSQTLASSGLTEDFAGTVLVHARILDHFGL